MPPIDHPAVARGASDRACNLQPLPWRGSADLSVRARQGRSTTPPELQERPAARERETEE